MKVVVNRCYGGFGLSKAAQELYAEKKGITLGKYQKTYESYDEVNSRDISRDDPVLVEVVETLGDRANGGYAKLEIVEIPDDVEWYVDEYDGKEWVSEVHRTW